MQGSAEARDARGRADVAQAWIGAVLSRAKKVPPLEDLTNPRPKKMTADQIAAGFRLMATRKKGLPHG